MADQGLYIYYGNMNVPLGVVLNRQPHHIGMLRSKCQSLTEARLNVWKAWTLKY